MHRSFLWRLGLIATLGAATAAGQGPASCGFHLDVITTDTSTHAPIADMPFTVGDIVGIPPGAPGNPYCGWAPLGSPFRLVITLPGGTLGPAPYGPGSPVTILWSPGAPMVAMPLGAPVIPTCTGTPHIIGVLPFGGAVVDGAGLLGPPPIFATADPGFPNRFSVTLFYPPFFMPPITFQAVVMTPFGMGVTNAVTLMGGPNPAEASLLPALLPSDVIPPSPLATDDGQATFVPTPPGFMFYGVPTPFCDVDTNGFVDFCPGAATCGGADPSSLSTAAGCAPGTLLTRPRINVNHYNADFMIMPPVPMIPGLTVEMAPPGPFWPARTIIRWKNVMSAGTTPLSLNHSTHTLELFDDGRIVIVRQGNIYGPVGIGPGGAGQGYGGPSPMFGSTCAMPGGISLSTLWGFGAYFGAFGGVIEQDAPGFNLALGSLGVVFTPLAPGTYMANVL